MPSAASPHPPDPATAPAAARTAAGGDDGDRDALLMARVARGDERAFEALYDAYSGRVLAMLRGLCGEPQLAEDLLQEVFVLIWRKAATYHPGRGRVAGWIYAVTRNRVIDHQRRRRPLVPLPAADVADGSDGLPAAERDDLRIALDQALDGLGEEERDSVRTAYFGGLTYREAAERLDIPLGTLKSRIRSALARLRRQLGDRVPRR